MNESMHKPGIAITASTAIEIEESHTLKQLSHVSGRLAKLLDDDKMVSLAKLMTAVGDLSASVIDSASGTHIDFADEVADVIIYAMIIAHNYGVDGSTVQHAIQRRMTDMASASVGKILDDAMKNRGFGNQSSIILDDVMNTDSFNSQPGIVSLATGGCVDCRTH